MGDNYGDNRVHRNMMRMEFDSISNNESLARMAVASFILPLNPTLDEINDVKTAVSEAVTNSIIHGYEKFKGTVFLKCERRDDLIIVTIKDNGVGIENVEKAMEPLYTTKPFEGRAGMGFMFMDVFMDDLDVQSSKGYGTTVTMKKRIGRRGQNERSECGDIGTDHECSKG
ncbi:MAG: anti-sigma F factor [Lachnospiraceae bacterium]|nr:anti-sigma F factor [Lachnospiraceae bacterium]